ncbi:mannitol dehydrogenase family protein [Martelella mediterranea]|uniref:Tagaturonate reductase n=1 Tax=Martelella mediterranea TaxID=293089 RepID=A0A4V2V3F4_9HYPH|nr:mannitol dehydrogenase family protein [Martelella mediterranea]TCT31770.1 tagaturonate reductase [Martelella mediterranea]
MSKTPIIQFGTSRFLQAHLDLFISEAAANNEALGGITVVQTSGHGGRAKRLSALAEGYGVRLRGLSEGERVDETLHVTSIKRGLGLVDDRAEVQRIIVEEAEIIVSNTADAGFRPQPADRSSQFDPAMSYPAKLAHLLRPRFEAGAAAPQIMPTELVRSNGDVLRGLVLDAAARMDTRYRTWLAEEVLWVNSLVDRIVSEPLEPAGAIAEPYALWAIEDRSGLRLPCRHPAINVVADLGPIERRKLFVLNLGHTWMVSDWLARGRVGAIFVRDVMADPDWSNRLRALYAEEVMPGFVAAGEEDGIEDYIEITLERFANPFLDHRLEDIAANHGEKLRRRIGAFVEWARQHGDGRGKPLLEAALKEEDT